MMQINNAMIIDRIITDARIRLSVVSLSLECHPYYLHQPYALRLCEA